jgi:hypothetical protein
MRVYFLIAFLFFNGISSGQTLLPISPLVGVPPPTKTNPNNT